MECLGGVVAIRALAGAACTHVHTCIHTMLDICVLIRSRAVAAPAHMQTCTHAHMHTCTHAHMHTCTHAHMHTHKAVDPHMAHLQDDTRLDALTHAHTGAYSQEMLACLLECHNYPPSQR
jgi:hypothetical protein